MAAELEQLRVSLVAELVGREAFEQLKREVNQVKAATTSLDTTQQKLRTTVTDAEKAVRQQRQAFSQAGMQINQFAGQIAAGTSPMVAFTQQIGDVAYVVGQAGESMGRVGRFLQGPWAAAILIAISVLGPLIGKLFETKDATEELEKAEKLKKDTTDTLREAILDYNSAVAKTPAAQRLAIQSMIDSAKADMEATIVAQRGAQNRINAIKAEIIAIQARNKARGQQIGGDIGGGAARAGAAIAGVIVESNALGDLAEAEKLLNERRNDSAKTFAKLTALRARLVNFDQSAADTAEKAAERQAKAYEKAAKAAEKLANKEEDLYQDYIAKNLGDAIKGVEAYSKAYGSTIDRNISAAAAAFDAQIKLNEEIRGSAIDEQMEEFLKPIDRVKSMSEAMGQAFSDGIKGMITGAMSFKQVMSNVIDSVINKLFEMFVVQQITGMISKGLTSLGIPGFKAIGGPVQSGKPYIVGERGPEMFVPSRSGSIVPNKGLGGGMTINVDARGASDPAAVRAQVEQGIAQAAPYIIAAAQNKTLTTAARPRLPGTLG
jgi:hypothetical protein